MCLFLSLTDTIQFKPPALLFPINLIRPHIPNQRCNYPVQGSIFHPVRSCAGIRSGSCQGFSTSLLWLDEILPCTLGINEPSLSTGSGLDQRHVRKCFRGRANPNCYFKSIQATDPFKKGSKQRKHDSDIMLTDNITWNWAQNIFRLIWWREIIMKHSLRASVCKCVYLWRQHKSICVTELTWTSECTLHLLLIVEEWLRRIAFTYHCVQNVLHFRERISTNNYTTTETPLKIFCPITKNINGDVCCQDPKGHQKLKHR